MTDRKLTPRVGDRVLFKFAGATQIGTVERLHDVDVALDESHPMAKVVWANTARFSYENKEDLTVVDRDPVEWPEGWRPSKFEDDLAVQDLAGSFNREELQAVLANGSDMLARWDELMGGDQ